MLLTIALSSQVRASTILLLQKIELNYHMKLKSMASNSIMLIQSLVKFCQLVTNLNRATHTHTPIHKDMMVISQAYFLSLKKESVLKSNELFPT
jgi:hypothetical protein